MLFERFEDKGLAHYSYAVGCPGAGRIAIVDPRRDIDLYLDFAQDRHVAITHVLETHIHADYASGARELAKRTGAELLVSGYDQGEVYEVQFAHRDIREGDTLRLGSVRIEPLHTPGHTPEHLSFLVFDESRSVSTPILLLSGDFLFVGSLGRPDLLGEAAKLDLAKQMFASVRDKLPRLPDGLEIHPAHGAGSMCGSGMGGRPSSTLGFERIANPYLNPKLSQDGFVHELLAKVPPFPDYYRRMKRLNSEGPRILDGLPGTAPLEAATFREAVSEGAAVIDLRDQSAFGGAHIPRSFGIGAGQSLSTWAAWVAPADQPLLLVANDPSQIEPAVRALVRVGLDDIRGFLKGGIAAWREAGFELSQTPQLSVAQLHEKLRLGGGIQIIDVRADDEWNSGHVEGAIHVMAGVLGQRLESLPSGPLAIICGSGYRSTVAASVLERADFDTVYNVTGGMTAWLKAGYPVQKEVATTPA